MDDLDDLDAEDGYDTWVTRLRAWSGKSFDAFDVLHGVDLDVYAAKGVDLDVYAANVRRSSATTGAGKSALIKSVAGIRPFEDDRCGGRDNCR